jgi:hypothetical protein
MMLTPKQEAFARAYLECGNASEAYRRSYDAARMKPTTVNESASRLLGNPAVAARVRALQAVTAQAHAITVEERVRTYTQLARLALERGDLGTAVRAQDSITRIAGLFAENRRNERDAVAELPRELRDQLAALARARLDGLH